MFILICFALLSQARASRKKAQKIIDNVAWSGMAQECALCVKKGTNTRIQTTSSPNIHTREGVTEFIAVFDNHTHHNIQLDLGNTDAAG